MNSIREGTVTLKDTINGVAIQRSIIILGEYGRFVVVNIDKRDGWSEVEYVSKSHMFSDITLANKWFDKLCKDVNL